MSTTTTKSTKASIGGDACIVLDGSMGEGGGQIVRNAITYATILQQEIRIHSIRAGRMKSGLRAQHVTSLQLAMEIGQNHGTSYGVHRNSTEIHYQPSNLTTAHHPSSSQQQQHHHQPLPRPPSQQQFLSKSSTGTQLQHNTTFLKCNTGTAASIVLLLQTAVPCALFRHSPSRIPNTTDSNPIEFLFSGGTNATMAPQYEYWNYILIPTLVEQCGLDDGQSSSSSSSQQQQQQQQVFDQGQIHSQLIRRGYFPKGGGQVNVRIHPLTCPLHPIRLNKEQGEIVSFFIHVFHSHLPHRIAVETVESALCVLHDNYPQVRNVESKIGTDSNTMDSGLGILVVAYTTTGCRLAGSALSSPPHRKPRDVGHTAAMELVQALDDGGCVDDWLQDQLIVFMTLAKGVSEMRTGSLTRHTQTAMWIAKKMTGVEFEVTKLSNDETPNITCTTAENASKFKDDISTAYGQEGRIPGKHLIRCHGIGLCPLLDE